jgi:acyl-CoA thioesterase FadM
MLTTWLLIFAGAVLVLFLPTLHLTLAFHHRHRTLRADDSVSVQAVPESPNKSCIQFNYELLDETLATAEFDQLMARIRAKLKETAPKR